MIHPFEVMREEGIRTVAGFFYNPNIHPYTEYRNRKNAVEEYAQKRRIRVFFHKYDMRLYFRRVLGHENFGARCQVCWRMRLEETARFAAMNGYSHITTTLLVSPYQDQAEIRTLGDEAAHAYGVEFVYRDLRSGFKKAQIEAKEENIYRQKYCGCLFSEQERFEKVIQRTK